MKQPTTKQIAAQIKRNNAKFKKASPAQKRVMIAKDVIARIQSRQYTPERGTWVDGPLYDAAADAVTDDGCNPQMQPLILSGEKCNVCALGGAFVSCTALNNQQDTREFVEQSDCIGQEIVDRHCLSNGLADIFKPAQLCLIETAFEAGGGYGADWQDMDDFPGGPKISKAIKFGELFGYNDRTCLLAIMRNIVKNKGTFKP